MSTTFDTLPPVSRSADVLHVGDTTGRLDHLPRSGSGLPLRVQQTEHSDRTSVTVRALRPLVISWYGEWPELSYCGFLMSKSSQDSQGLTTGWREHRYIAGRRCVLERIAIWATSMQSSQYPLSEHCSGSKCRPRRGGRAGKLGSVCVWFVFPCCQSYGTMTD